MRILKLPASLIKPPASLIKLEKAFKLAPKSLKIYSVIFRQIITKNHPKIIDSSTSGACKIFSSPPRFICYFFDPKRTNSEPIPTFF